MCFAVAGEICHNFAPSPLVFVSLMRLLTRLRPLFWPSLVILLAVFALRYGLIEAGRLPADCDGARASTLACTGKWLLVQSFLHQRLGWLALALALAAFTFESRRTALIAWLTALAGLVLYNYDHAGVAAMMSLLVWVRTPARGRA